MDTGGSENALLDFFIQLWQFQEENSKIFQGNIIVITNNQGNYMKGVSTADFYKSSVTCR